VPPISRCGARRRGAACPAPAVKPCMRSLRAPLPDTVPRQACAFTVCASSSAVRGKRRPVRAARRTAWAGSAARPPGTTGGAGRRGRGTGGLRRVARTEPLTRQRGPGVRRGMGGGVARAHRLVLPVTSNDRFSPCSLTLSPRVLDLLGGSATWAGAPRPTSGSEPIASGGGQVQLGPETALSGLNRRPRGQAGSHQGLAAHFWVTCAWIVRIDVFDAAAIVGGICRTRCHKQ